MQSFSNANANVANIHTVESSSHYLMLFNSNSWLAQTKINSPVLDGKVHGNLFHLTVTRVTLISRSLE